MLGHQRVCALLIVSLLARKSRGVRRLPGFSPYNVCLGGDHGVSLQTTLNAMRTANPDVVGVQEADSNGPAMGLGYHWYMDDPIRDLHLLERTPRQAVR